MSLPTPEELIIQKVQELIIQKVQEKRSLEKLKTVGGAAHDLDVP